MYRAVSDAGDKLTRAYFMGQAGQAYRDASTGLEIPVASGEEAYNAGLQAMDLAKRAAEARGESPETIAKTYEPTMAALETERGRGASTRYSIGQGAGYQMGDAPFSRTQKRAAGLQAASDVWYGMGDTERGGQAESTAMSLRQGELALLRGEREEKAQKRVDDVAKAWQNPMARMQQIYNMDEGAYGQGEHAGKKANYKELPDGGAIVWNVDKDGKMVGDAQRFSAQDVRREASKHMLMDMVMANPSNLDAQFKLQELGVKQDELDARKKFWADQGEHWKESIKVQREQLDATKKHFADQYDVNKQNAATARGQLVLAETRHGKNSPEYKAAKSAHERQEAYNTGIEDLAVRMDKGEDPEKLFAAAARFTMKHKDRMPKITETDVAGNRTERIVNPVEEQLGTYTRQFANRQTAEAQAQYGTDTGIVAIPGKGGIIGWRSNRTPRDITYGSLAELVKEDGIKPPKVRGLAPASAPAPIQFPYTPSGERGGTGVPMSSGVPLSQSSLFRQAR
jgi:hypothetical protein